MDWSSPRQPSEDSPEPIVFEPCLMARPEKPARMLLIDESWQLLSSAPFQKPLSEAFQIGRKFSSGAAVRQSLEDFGPGPGTNRPDTQEPCRRGDFQIQFEPCLMTAPLRMGPVILDEYGYYAAAGFGGLASLCRSLGFQATFAAQTLPACQVQPPCGASDPASPC